MANYGYRGRRKRRKNLIKPIMGFLMLFVLGGATALLFTQGYIVFSSTGITIGKPQYKEIYVDNSNDTVKEDEIIEEVIPVEENIKAIYFDTLKINDQAYIDSVFSSIYSKEYSALVIKVKNDDGTFNYPLNYSETLKTDLSNITNKAILEGVYVIADISVYKDTIFANDNKNLAIKNIKNGTWLDEEKNAYIDPYSDLGNAYILDICNKLFDSGFSEVLLSDFHFPATGTLNLLKYTESSIARDQILVNRAEQFSNLGPISIKMSNDVFMSSSITSENMPLLAQKVENIYIEINDEPTLYNFKQLDIDNKATISNNSYFIDTVLDYIKK